MELTNEQYALLSPDWSGIPLNTIASIAVYDPTIRLNAFTWHEGMLEKRAEDMLRYSYRSGERHCFNRPKKVIKHVYDSSKEHDRLHNTRRHHGVVKNTICVRGLSILPNVPSPGEFWGLPIGSMIVQGGSELRWRLIHKDRSKGFTMCRANNPTYIITNVNPNLGIRRCLKKHTPFKVRRSDTWSGVMDIQMPVTEADVRLAERMFRAIEDELPRNELRAAVAMREHIVETKYSYVGDEASSELTIVGAAAADDWESLELMCG